MFKIKIEKEKNILNVWEIGENSLMMVWYKLKIATNLLKENRD
jgi:hypothetical protein